MGRNWIHLSWSIVFPVLACACSCGEKNARQTDSRTSAKEQVTSEVQRTVAGHKILHINSYHQGYVWSDSIETAIQNALEGSNTPVELRVFRMDSIRHQEESFRTRMVNQAKMLLNEWQPDIVIASDDNACRYIAAPFLKNTDIPVVFCGVNWDASIYGFPCENVTGMVEIDPVDRLLRELKPFAVGERIGYLCADVLSPRKVIESLQTKCGITFADGTAAQTFDEWKTAYVRLQKTTDLIILSSHMGIPDWDGNEAVAWVMEKTQIPVGTMLEHASPLALIGVVKVPEEQGNWAAKTALRILEGESVAEIPVARNRASRVILNIKLAEKMGIKFPLELVHQATFVGEEKH